MSDSDSALECIQAVKKMIAVSESNKALLDDYNTNTINQYNENLRLWNIKRQNNQDQLFRWQNRTGEYQIYADSKTQKTNEERLWNNCVSWLDTSPGHHNDWCVNDIGPGWYHSGQAGVCSPGFGKGICKRTPDQVNIEDQDYQNVKPALFNEPKPLYPPQPGLNPLGSITCCSSSVAVENSQLTNVGIEQLNTCINEKKTETSPDTSVPPSTVSSSPSTVSSSLFSNINQWYIIGFVIIIMIIMSSSSILFISFNLQ
jgi:hypothetical protein